MGEYTHSRPLRLFEICAGYGSQALALERLRRDYPDFGFELAGWCECDPESSKPIDEQPAVIAHNALHPDGIGKNWGDLTKIDWEQVPDFDLLTASTPCQSISSAGLQHGFVKGSGTRSSIIWNVHDCVRVKRPRYILMENVSAILSDKFFPLLHLWMVELERMGYTNFMPTPFTLQDGSTTRNGCLNSKHYGCPQNRERWFMVSILDCKEAYYFPKPFKLEKRLKDVLEKSVDESCYLSQERVDGLVLGNDSEDADNSSEPCIAAMRGRSDGEWYGSEHQQRLEIGGSDMSFSLTSVAKDNLLLEPCIARDHPIEVGCKYGRLLVVKKTEKRQGTNYLYECMCDCGNTTLVSSGRLGITTFSCGCLRNEKNKTHGMSKSRLYNIYTCIKGRCYNKNNPSYKHYGSRGIQMCDEWLHSFDAFMKWALSNGYQEGLSIDRINNDGDYSPNNCRWADETMQVNNRSVWGEVPYHGIVRDNTGYRAQITIKGKKVYIGHSTNDIEYLVNLRNQYIDKHNLPCKKNVFHKDSLLAEPTIIEDFYPDRPARVYEGEAPTLRSDRAGLKVAEPIVLGWVRDTKGNIVSRPEVDVANCVTAGKRDNTQNYVLEQVIEEVRKAFPNRGILMYKGNPYFVRKLSIRELYRLMDLEENDIDTLMATDISKTNHSKLAGNSIVVSVLYHIFRTMFIDTVPIAGTQTTLF